LTRDKISDSLDTLEETHLHICWWTSNTEAVKVPDVWFCCVFGCLPGLLPCGFHES